jgi:hypothetical protein
MQVQCIDNSGFEDQLTEGQYYSLIAAQGNSVKLEDDGGIQRWYGRLKFSVGLCSTCTSRQAA